MNPVLPSEYLDQIDRRILDLIQWYFPLEACPFAALAQRLNVSEINLIDRLRVLRDRGIIREISALFEARKLGFHSALIAMSVAPEHIEEAAAVPSAHPGVSHNYERNHAYNLWFTLMVPGHVALEDEALRIARRAHADDHLVLPAVGRFKLGVDLDMGTRDTWDDECNDRVTPPPDRTAVEDDPPADHPPVSPLEITAIRALQRNLPLEPHPFERLAESFDMTEEELLEIANRLLESGALRRYGAVLRHQRVGYTANAMGCWFIPPERMDEAGARAAVEQAVSHCYERPAYPPRWPYNFFTMIHGRSDEEVRAIADRLRSDLLPLEHALLFTVREFKKQRVCYYEE